MSEDYPTAPPSPKKDLPEPFGPSTRVITKAQAPEARRLRLNKAADERLASRSVTTTEDRPTTRAGQLIRNLKSGRDLLRGGR